MHLHIRKWKEEDIPALVDLTFQWGYETTAEKIKTHLKEINEANNTEVFIAEVDGKVAARIFVCGHLSLGTDPFAEIHDLVVDESYRRKGVGNALIEQAKEWSREKGFEVLRLRSNSKRIEANIFYPAIGFALEKQQNVYAIKL